VSGRTVVTGGLGFIGSELVRSLTADGQAVVNVDLDTYAGDSRRLASVAPDMVETVILDVASPQLAELIAAERPSQIFHLAAETHVTRSEGAAETFFHANVEGTRRVLDAAVAVGGVRVVHMSTDEVYGPCAGDPFREDQKLEGEGDASSAYARSKALADDLALSYGDRLDVVVARPTNCIGPWQHPEKAVPRWITRALRGERLPVWGDGMQVRDWMYVADAVAGLRRLAARGERGQVYNLGPVGGGTPNLEIAQTVARAAGLDADAVYLSHYDRPQHDRRYAVDSSRIAALGWSAQWTVPAALAETVSWYRANEAWWSTLVADAEALYAD
jgi:dTDP-glucose 4,6-dehydratase